MIRVAVIRVTLGLVVILAWGCGHAAMAHPFHVSIAEAEFNAQTGKLEVALRVHPHDLELALERRAGHTVDLDETEQVDQLITSYLQEVFVLRPDAGTSLRLAWVGKEVGVKFAWLFFEFPLPEISGAWTVENRIFHQRLEDQVNTITFKQQRGERSLSFTRSHARRKLQLPLAARRSAAPQGPTAPSAD